MRVVESRLKIGLCYFGGAFSASALSKNSFVSIDYHWLKLGDLIGSLWMTNLVSVIDTSDSMELYAITEFIARSNYMYI